MMKMQPSLEVVTITMNDIDGVAATILSTRNLRSGDGVRQHVIDGSSAPIAGQVNELVAAEEHVEYTWQKPAGIAAAFNLGIGSASAEWLWFLNGGDVVHRDLDTDLLLRLLGSSRADVLICQLEFMQSRQLLEHPPLWALWPPIRDNWVPHPATFVRTSLFRRFGAFSDNYQIAMDLDLWMRLFGSNIVVDMLSIPVVSYDEHGVSATNTVQTSREANRIIVSNMGMLTKKWVARGIHLFRAVTRL